MGEGVSAPTWARFNPENAPRTHFSIFGTVVCRFWEGFRRNVDDFQRLFTYFGHVIQVCSMIFNVFVWKQFLTQFKYRCLYSVGICCGVLFYFLFVLARFSCKPAIVQEVVTYTILNKTLALHLQHICEQSLLLLSCDFSCITQSFGLLSDGQILLEETIQVINFPAPGFE